MSTTRNARRHLEAVRDLLTPDAYESLAGALALAEQAELRRTPGREATSSTRVRDAGGFRRQPHLDLGEAPRSETFAPRESDPTRAARKKHEERSSRKDGTEYGRARLIH
jgi:hypothetical protein